ncbi:MAG TPA: acyl-CoA dehydrogenase family protein [Marmoricola sp.]|nr:acyl-CoA dehydrogenase family protein [Marmoricola sp.]
MKFELTEEQAGFARSIGDLLAKADTVAAARAWAAGDTGPGLGIWKRLADQGLSALVVPEEAGGLGGSPVDLVVAHEVLGHHLAVGPWVESSAYLATALSGDALEAVAGGAVATVAVPPHVPFALDADVADVVYVGTEHGLARASVREVRASVDTTRRLGVVSPDSPVLEDAQSSATEAAFDVAVLACAAQLVGCGERLLADSVAYAKQRRQFGREIGSYQALKHQLADVRIGLDFARPLVHGAALGEVPVSAAKVAAADAAYRASRVGLQVHGAIGYTAEFDLGLWITRVRALVTAWGTPAYHRARVLATITEAAR